MYLIIPVIVNSLFLILHFLFRSIKSLVQIILQYYNKMVYIDRQGIVHLVN
jgi:hypothetical protein